MGSAVAGIAGKGVSAAGLTEHAAVGFPHYCGHQSRPGQGSGKRRLCRDLYFRLNVINIRLAPLRERKEDIPLLINHFLNRAGGSHTLTAETMEVLLSYEWPGNVRELENCIQHMVEQYVTERKATRT